jgi:hypothetical protein
MTTATPPTSATATPIGRVASPLHAEATSVRCFFWVPDGRLVEKTQIVRTASLIGGEEVTFYGVIEEVYRRSRRRSMDEEVDVFDGDLAYEPPFSVAGVTYAEATILASDPPYLTPPREESVVYLGGREDAARAYGFDQMSEDLNGVRTDWSLPVGLVRNGASRTVGLAKIDLRDLIGERAGHLNVTGQAGRGTKSSFLLALVRALTHAASALDSGAANRPPFSPRPIVFNVKGNDLMYIDLPNRLLTMEGRERWTDEMGIPAHPFERARFFAPCRLTQGRLNQKEPRVARPVPPDRMAKTYYWTLADVVRFGLWPYLFSDAAQTSETLMAMVDHVLGLLAEDVPARGEHPAGLKLRDPDKGTNGLDRVPQSFRELRDWLKDALRDKDHPARDSGIHAFGTCRALLSRLGLVLDQEGRTIFDNGTGEGRPLDVTSDATWQTRDAAGRITMTSDPIVIDIADLPAELRRFVVAAVLDQIKTRQMAQRPPGRTYFLVLDELGIYAPRGARDPITRLFEHVAAQLRSQGIILLGAQQHASQISETIFGNAEFKVLGATSAVELESPTWNRLLTAAQKDRALKLRPEEKMVLTPRGWMNVVVPFPAWAMKESEIGHMSPDLAPEPAGRNGRDGELADWLRPPRE